MIRNSITGMYIELIYNFFSNRRSDQLTIDQYKDSVTSGNLTSVVSTLNKVDELEPGTLVALKARTADVSNKIVGMHHIDGNVVEKFENPLYTISYGIVAMKIDIDPNDQTTKKYINKLIVEDDIPRHIYLPNPYYNPDNVIISVNMININYGSYQTEYINSGEYPLLKVFEDRAPTYWDRLYEQTILGREYVWYRLNPIPV